ncbi:MAG: adenine phosphoribosyltransferase [Bryobacteraceae bacterium]|jgi:adenine phosphoribosyltransferase
MNLKSLIREVPDFPKPGINFYDITTLLKDAAGLRAVIDDLGQAYHGKGIEIVAGIEARGFIFAPAVAYALNAGFVPVRKPKKLPSITERVEYELEYGTDILEIHKDAIEPGQKVLIVDDVLATGGTAKAVAQLIERLGGNIVGLSFVLELDFLNGRAKLPGHNITSLLHY